MDDDILLSTARWSYLQDEFDMYCRWVSGQEFVSLTICLTHQGMYYPTLFSYLSGDWVLLVIYTRVIFTCSWLHHYEAISIIYKYLKVLSIIQQRYRSCSAARCSCGCGCCSRSSSCSSRPAAAAPQAIGPRLRPATEWLLEPSTP